MSHIDEVAESVSREVRTQKAISILMSNKDEATRRYLLAVYSDPELHNIYNGLRADASLNNSIMDDRKLTIKFPNPTVFKFVSDVLKVKYGDEWLQNPKIYYEDIVIPWVIRSR